MRMKNKITSREPDSKKESSVSYTKKADSSNSINSPIKDILNLQKAVGNQTVQGMIKSGSIQAKLEIGQPGDIYEHEADQVADEVMRMSDPQVNRQGEKKEGIQAKENVDASPAVSPSVENGISSSRGSGQPLPESTRAFFEPRFGADFSNVRIHNDSDAAKSAQSINARAFTIGRDVVFDAGQYAPETTQGKKLLGHELVHVAQQQPSNKTNIISQRTNGIIQAAPAKKNKIESVKDFEDFSNSEGFSLMLSKRLKFGGKWSDKAKAEDSMVYFYPTEMTTTHPGRTKTDKDPIWANTPYGKHFIVGYNHYKIYVWVFPGLSYKQMLQVIEHEAVHVEHARSIRARRKNIARRNKLQYEGLKSMGEIDKIISGFEKEALDEPGEIGEIEAKIMSKEESEKKIGEELKFEFGANVLEVINDEVLAYSKTFASTYNASPNIAFQFLKGILSPIPGKDQTFDSASAEAKKKAIEYIVSVVKNRTELNKFKKKFRKVFKGNEKNTFFKEVLNALPSFKK